MRLAFAACIAFLWTVSAMAQAPALSKDPFKNAETARGWAEQDKTDQANNIRIETLSFNEAGSGKALIASFTLKNNNSSSVKDIRIVCEQIAANGTAVRTSGRTIYRQLKAKTSLLMRNFNMGAMHPQTSRSSCRVGGATTVR